MLSSPKPLQFILSAVCLTGITAFASADQACCAGKSACEVDCSKAIAHVQGLFERIVTPLAPECGPAPATPVATRAESLAPWEELTGILATRPETWKIIKPMILATFASKASDAIRNNVLGLLAQQYSDPAVAIASELAESYPTTEFTQDQVIAFAEAGSKRFWGIAADLQQTEGDLLPTALIAIHGDEGGCASLRVVLRECVARPDTSADETDRLVAGLALEKLGEPEHLVATRVHLRASVLAALDHEDLDLARRLTLTASFLDEACSSYSPARISYFEARLDGYCRERAEDVRSADQIFALVERLFAL
ncbi:MAG: hypothetical protein ACI8QZ_004006 [Chlamydiales bacterium]|jgi:hypothetical protein